MASSISSFFTTLISVFLLLFHLGCFIYPSSTSSPIKRRKLTFSSPTKPHTSKSSSSSFWTFIKHLICIKHPHTKTQIQSHPTSVPSSIVSLTTTTTTTTPPPPHVILSTPSRKCRTNSLSFSLSETDISFDNPSFPLRNDIFPCSTCGEIFHKTHLLDHHQSIKHAVSELFDGDSGKNIVRIIFKTGWNDHKKIPQIHRILKIHNSPKIVSRFEDYRESVKSKASKLGTRRRDERCIADGNELLRFHCSTFMCNLGQNGNSSLCSQNYCNVCGIIRSGFSAKMDGIASMCSSWKAHVALPDDLEDEFAFMNVKRAMLICRVVAGRIGSDQEDEGGFDSVFGRGNGGSQHGRLDEDELIVFNPRAVLPCFTIVYSLV